MKYSILLLALLLAACHRGPFTEKIPSFEKSTAVREKKEEQDITRDPFLPLFQKFDPGLHLAEQGRHLNMRLTNPFPLPITKLMIEITDPTDDKSVYLRYPYTILPEESSGDYRFKDLYLDPKEGFQVTSISLEFYDQKTDEDLVYHYNPKTQGIHRLVGLSTEKPEFSGKELIPKLYSQSLKYSKDELVGAAMTNHTPYPISNYRASFLSQENQIVSLYFTDPLAPGEEFKSFIPLPGSPGDYKLLCIEADLTRKEQTENLYYDAQLDRTILGRPSEVR